jgi:hypothetical protein
MSKKGGSVRGPEMSKSVTFILEIANTYINPGEKTAITEDARGGLGAEIMRWLGFEETVRREGEYYKSENEREVYLYCSRDRKS